TLSPARPFIRRGYGMPLAIAQQLMSSLCHRGHTAWHGGLTAFGRATSVVPPPPPVTSTPPTDRMPARGEGVPFFFSEVEKGEKRTRRQDMNPLPNRRAHPGQSLSTDTPLQRALPSAVNVPCSISTEDAQMQIDECVSDRAYDDLIINNLFISRTDYSARLRRCTSTQEHAFMLR
ncbi:hypothetical protein KUCAC02_013354, partial [Chaenocephalus aceratus]